MKQKMIDAYSKLGPPNGLRGIFRGGAPWSATPISTTDFLQTPAKLIKFFHRGAEPPLTLGSCYVAV